MRHETLQESIQFAGKEHRCSYCGGKIHKNEKYLRSKIRFDDCGEISVYWWKCHFECQAMALVVDEMDNYNDEGLSEEGFSEAICEAWTAITGDESEEAWDIDFFEKLKLVKETHAQEISEYLARFFKTYKPFREKK